MPNLFRGQTGPAASIINAFSSGGTSGTQIAATTTNNLREVTAAGAYSGTPGTFQSVISHTGRGCINALTVYAKDTTSRTVRCRVTIDGTVIFDATSSTLTVANTGLVPIGAIEGGATGRFQFQRIEYNDSLLVEVASSVASEAAANIGIGVNRETWVS